MKNTREFLTDIASKRTADLEELAKRVEALEQLNNREDATEEELKAAGDELDDLNAKKAELEAELAEINAQIAELDKEPTEEANPQRKKLNFMTKESRGINTMTYEERKAAAEKFAQTERMAVEAKETRATLISGGKVVTPTGVDGIVDTFNTVSSIIDLVKVENCKGMGSNKIAYQKAHATGATQTEGSAVTATDPKFDFVTITSTTKMVLSYISEQARKQTPLDYEGKVKNSAMVGLRKEMATLVTNALKTGALIDTTSVVGNVASSKGVINEKTLRNLVLAYGGSENVEGSAWLFLNKKDLIAFGDVRGTNEKKAVYEIIPSATNPNVGQIKDGGLTVNYCISSDLFEFNGRAQTSADVITMIYGNPKNCELDLFGDYEVKVSEDYKFGEGLLTVRGTVDAGAAVIHDNGFVALMLPKTGA